MSTCNDIIPYKKYGFLPYLRNQLINKKFLILAALLLRESYPKSAAPPRPTPCFPRISHERVAFH